MNLSHRFLGREGTLNTHWLFHSSTLPLPRKRLPKLRLFFFQEQPRQPHPSVSATPSQPPSPSSPLASFTCPQNTPAVPAPIQAPSVILPLPGQSVDRLCVDFRRPQELVNLLSDPDQGERHIPSYPPREIWPQRTPQLPTSDTGTPPHRLPGRRRPRQAAPEL